MKMSKLPGSLNVRADPVKLKRPAMSCISVCEGHLDTSKLNESSSKLNKQDPSWMDVT